MNLVGVYFFLAVAVIWYQERRAYRPQLVAYTFAKLAYEAQRIKKCLNYKGIWDTQKVSEVYYNDIANIGKIVFDVMYDESRSTANIESYCKKEECWNIVQKRSYELSEDLLAILISPADLEVEAVQAKKEQKMITDLTDEVAIFFKGTAYWESMIQRGREQQVLNPVEVEMLGNAIKYCNGIYAQLSKHQLREIARITAKLNENGIV